jgi:hypothetical protein
VLDPAGDVDLSEGRLERSTPAVDRLADDGDAFGREPTAKERRDLAGEKLDRAARARALEEADRAVEGRPDRRLVGEQLALEMPKRGGREAETRTGELLDAAGGELCEVRDRSLERLERGPRRLVRNGDRHLGARRESLEQRPLRARQILEAVREHGRAGPGGQVAAQALDGAATEPVAIAQPERLQLFAVGDGDAPDVAAERIRLDETRSELAQRLQQRVREPRRRG